MDMDRYIEKTYNSGVFRCRDGEKTPVIALVPLVDIARDSYWMLPGYMNGIRGEGGLPVMLPLTSDEREIDIMADRFDGFLFTGGHDVTPETYGEEDRAGNLSCCPERDSMEGLLLDRAVSLGKPVLGICRGLQFINAHFGGTLIQDIPTELNSAVRHRQGWPYDEPSHSVRIEEGTLLHEIIGRGILNVNSCHHQGIRKLSEKLVSTAKAPDGLIEAVEGKKEFFSGFMLAVQWHPEFLYGRDPDAGKIFRAFVEAAGEVMD